MKKKLMLFGLFVAMGVAWAGIHYRIRIVIALVFVALAVFSFTLGVRMILTRKADIPTGDGPSAHQEFHTGLSAQFWGVLFLIFSMPIGAFGVSYWLHGDNPPKEIIEGMAASPFISGLAMITTAVAIVLYGLTRVLPGKEAFRETQIGPFERGIAAVYYSIVGTLTFGVGLVRMFSPGTLTRLRDAAIDWVLELVK